MKGNSDTKYIFETLADLSNIFIALNNKSN